MKYLISLMFILASSLSAGSHSEGGKSFLVLYCDFSDGDPAYRDDITQAVADEVYLNNVDKWFRNATHNHTWVSSVKLVKLTLPEPQDYYKEKYYWALNDALSTSGESAGDYDRIVIVASGIISSTGLAGVGGRYSWYNSWQKAGILYHELGHNAGVYHANGWRSSSEEPRGANGEHREYRDGNGIMGGGSNTFNPLYKERLNYLKESDNEIINIINPGTYRLYQAHDETRLQGITRALKVPITGSSWYDKYIILGFQPDHKNRAVDGGPSRADRRENGLEVRSRGTYPSTGSHFLDMTPGSAPDADADRDDGLLMMGMSYVEGPGVNGVHQFGGHTITPVAKGSEVISGQTFDYLDVEVHYGAPSANAPTGDFTASSISAAVGEAITFNASFSDADGNDLAYQYLTSDGQYSWTNSASQEFSWDQPGIYLITLIVSDKTGQHTKKNLYVNIGDIPALPALNPAPAQLSGLEYYYY